VYLSDCKPRFCSRYSAQPRARFPTASTLPLDLTKTCIRYVVESFLPGEKKNDHSPLSADHWHVAVSISIKTAALPTFSSFNAATREQHQPKSCNRMYKNVGRDSSVGIATRYGLDGRGIKSRCEWVFPHPTRPAQGPTQPPVQWVPGLSRGYNGRGVGKTTHSSSSAEVKERV